MGSKKGPGDPPPPPPPVTEKRVEVQQASRDTRRQAKSRKGFAKTLLAGETGGFDSGKQKTLLG